MAIDVALLKELRERTGAGIVDCKKALEEAGNDIEKATTALREKGLAKAAKKASRVSAEGVFKAIVNGNNVLVYEVNCETDFVASNEKFKNFVDEVGKVLVASGAKCTDCALKATNANGETVEQMILAFIAIIGEKITLRNVQVISKDDAEVFGVYSHNQGKILVVVTGNGDEEALRNVAMHVCAYDPQYLNRESVDPEYIKKETEIVLKEALEENSKAAKPKPENIIQKMVDGRIAKELKAICLMDQAYAKDPGITVEQYLQSAKSTVKCYTRNVVGAGIEKKENNFAEEVYSQIK